MQFSKQQVRQARRDNAKFPEHLIAVPQEHWPETRDGSAKRIAVFRSRDFLVQVFAEPVGVLRLSINRTEWDIDRQRFKENITWDELQDVKAQAGFADFCAVEIFPPADHVVNVANMRHLWILKEPPKFMWAKPVEKPQ